VFIGYGYFRNGTITGFVVGDSSSKNMYYIHVCEDNEKGDDPGIKGKIEKFGFTRYINEKKVDSQFYYDTEDSCADPKTLEEYYCIDSTNVSKDMKALLVKKRVVDCTSDGKSCFDGACVEQKVIMLQTQKNPKIVSLEIENMTNVSIEFSWQADVPVIARLYLTRTGDDKTIEISKYKNPISAGVIEYVGLEQNTSYDYVFEVMDRQGNIARTSTRNFTTLMFVDRLYGIYGIEVEPEILMPGENILVKINGSNKNKFFNKIKFLKNEEVFEVQRIFHSKCTFFYCGGDIEFEFWVPDSWEEGVYEVWAVDNLKGEESLYEPYTSFKVYHCHDSDGVGNFNVSGYVEYTAGLFNDFCDKSGYAYDYYCDAQKGKAKKKLCEFNCARGVCVD